MSDTLRTYNDPEAGLVSGKVIAEDDRQVTLEIRKNDLQYFNGKRVLFDGQVLTLDKNRAELLNPDPEANKKRVV